MVDRSRELELAFGDGVKRVEGNERDTIVVQRRALRFTRDVAAGDVLSADDVEALRPAPAGALEPYRIGDVLGRKVASDKVAGDAIEENDLC
jgi:N-acetylneuraminate synthase